MRVSPCEGCPRAEACGGKSCPDWVDWFNEYWSLLRQKYLGIKPRWSTETEV